MKVKGGRLEFLVPHLLREPAPAPGLRAHEPAARRRAADAAHGPSSSSSNGGRRSREDLERVLGRITSLESWVDEWESLGREHEQGARDALALGRRDEARAATSSPRRRPTTSPSTSSSSTSSASARSTRPASRLRERRRRCSTRPPVPFEVTFRRRIDARATCALPAGPRTGAGRRCCSTAPTR